MEGGGGMDSYGKVLKMFSPLKVSNSLISKERGFCSFSSFLFFSMLLSPSFFLFSVSLLRMNSGIFKMFEEKTFFSNVLSNGMEVATPRFMKLGELRKIYRRWIHTLEWTYACQ
jgi:hypothetical protein